MKQHSSGKIVPTFSVSAVSEHLVRRIETLAGAMIFWSAFFILEERLELFIVDGPRRYFKSIKNYIDIAHIFLLVALCIEGARILQEHNKLEHVTHTEWINQFLVVEHQRVKVKLLCALELLYTWLRFLKLIS